MKRPLSAISIARQLVSLASTLPSMTSLSQELTSPESVMPRPTLRQEELVVGFQLIGQIGEAAHRLAGARRHRQLDLEHAGHPRARKFGCLNKW